MIGFKDAIHRHRGLLRRSRASSTLAARTVFKRAVVEDVCFPQDPFITDDHLLPYWEVSARLKIDEDFRNRAQDRSQVQQVVKGEIRQGNAEMISREVVSEVYGIEYFNGDDTVTAWWQSIREFNATATRMFTPYRTPGRQPQGTAKL